MKKQNKELQPTPDWGKYKAFIEQVEVNFIQPVSVTFRLLDQDYFPTDTEVVTRYRTEHTNIEGGFCYIHHFYLLIKDSESKENKARLAVSFKVLYDSKIPMSEEFDQVFREKNLFINTWPYFREFANSMTARLGWPPYIAPVFHA